MPIGWRAKTAIFAMVLIIASVCVNVNAIYVQTQSWSQSQSLTREDNGHAYLRVDGDDGVYGDQHLLTVDEDVDYIRYDYGQSSWSRNTGTFEGPATMYTYLGRDSIDNQGWLSNGTRYPYFYDFVNTTDDFTLSLEHMRHEFPVVVGEEFSVLIESNRAYYGTFNLTSVDEFFHFTLASRQDDCEMGAMVVDPLGRPLTEIYLESGDIQLMPFNPSVAGMYTVVLYAVSGNRGILTADLLLEAVEPILLEPDQIVEGLLPGSEMKVRQDDGDFVYTEIPPSAMTYQVTGNYTHPGRLRYSFNYMAMMGGTEPFIIVTGDSFYCSNELAGFMDGMGSPGDTYWYQSFRNGSYYFTVIGMDETQYTLLNEVPDTPALPLNQEFYIESPYQDGSRQAFKLNLAQDSVFVVNRSTESNPFDWTVWTVDDNNCYRYRTIPTHQDLESASPFYLPAGRYLLVATSSGMDDKGFYEFNVGPVLDGTGQVAVDAGRIIGVSVDTDPINFYRANLTLETRDNVTVSGRYVVLGDYGSTISTWIQDLGNRRAGLGWQKVSANWTSKDLGLPITYDRFSGERSIIAVVPYQVVNNTPGGSNEYHEYTVDYGIHFDPLSDDYFNGTGSLSVGSSIAIHNFTLGDPGESTEIYMLSVDASAGVWHNVTVVVSDVTSWTASVRQEAPFGAQVLRWLDLDDTLVGSTSDEAAFQFGTLEGQFNLIFYVERVLAGEGSLDVIIEPFTTNVLGSPPPIKYLGLSAESVDDLGPALIVVGGVGAAVAIVAIVYFVKVKK